MGNQGGQEGQEGNQGGLEAEEEMLQSLSRSLLTALISRQTSEGKALFEIHSKVGLILVALFEI